MARLRRRGIEPLGPRLDWRHADEASEGVAGAGRQAGLGEWGNARDRQVEAAVDVGIG